MSSGLNLLSSISLPRKSELVLGNLFPENGAAVADESSDDEGWGTVVKAVPPVLTPSPGGRLLPRDTGGGGVRGHYASAPQGPRRNTE